MCKKQANGIIRVDKQQNNHLLVYASAIKPGSRFTDEQSVITITPQHGLRLTGKFGMDHFIAVSKVEAATKDINAGTTFKIEMSEKEKSNRDRNAQSIYHTGEGVKENIYKGEMIKLEEED